MKILSIALAASVLAGAGASVAQAQGPFGPRNSGSTTDPSTGITTTSQLNADGSRTITRTDEDGNVISREVVNRPRPAVRVPAPKPPSGGSTTWDGETIIVEINPDGSRTIVIFDENGREKSRRNSNDEPVTHAGPKEPVGGSTTWEGERTIVLRNPDGSRTIVTVDENGKETSRRNSNDEPVTHAGPKEPVGGSTTWEGERTIVLRNPDGSRTIVTVDENGKETSRRNSKDEPVTHAGPKEKVGGSSTDPRTGETTTVELNPDGTKKITKTSPEGKSDAPKIHRRIAR